MIFAAILFMIWAFFSNIRKNREADKVQALSGSPDWGNYKFWYYSELLAYIFGVAWVLYWLF